MNIKWRVLAVLLVVVLACAFSGCWIHGTGSSVGYITTVEDTSVILGWDTVWFRVETGTYSSMQSQPEAYTILASNTILKEQLLETCRKNQKIELIFQQHVVNFAKSKDEVIGFKVLTLNKQ
jgi:2-polyprenyl-6-methoxyphenol hydroxylase-like FAD-dependent oxidoreductase